jgi:hypothetical protein
MPSPGHRSEETAAAHMPGISPLHPALQKLRDALASGAGLEALDDNTLDDLITQATNERFARTHRRDTPSTPRRAVALSALDLLGVPASLRTISAVAFARTGTPLDSHSLASARRDERRAWFRQRVAGMTPEPKLAPALHYQKVEPVHGLLTVSTWDLRRRVVTPHSPRVDRPTMVCALIDEADRLTDIDRIAASRLGLLACQMAADIPGATPPSTHQKDRASVRRAAIRELNRFATIATDEQLAAAHAMQTLSAGATVWGRTAAARGTH